MRDGAGPSRAWWGAGAALAGIVALAVFGPSGMWGGGATTPAPAPSASVEAPPAVAPSEAPPEIGPPKAPALPDAVAAPPDAYVGQWADAAGNRLTVARTAPDRYALVLTSGAAVETYDGVLSDGRVHFVRGIDGDWLQARKGDARCLYLGTGDSFCRTG
jgi:hypothetical protein